MLKSAVTWNQAQGPRLVLAGHVLCDSKSWQLPGIKPNSFLELRTSALPLSYNYIHAPQLLHTLTVDCEGWLLTGWS